MANEFTPAGSGAAVAPREPRVVDAGRGASWWSEGWRLFTPDVGVWLLIMLILIAVHICGAFIPVVGSLALQILFPVFSGGLMLGCRALDRGNPLTVRHLFGGFSQRTGPLVIVGLIYTGLAILILLTVAGMMIAIFGVAILGMLTGAADPSQTGIALGSVVVAVLLGILFFLLLLLPLIMAIWFAPAESGGSDEGIIPRVPAECHSVPGIWRRRHRARRHRDDTVWPWVVRARAGRDCECLRVVLRHLRGQKRVVNGIRSRAAPRQAQFSGACKPTALRTRAAIDVGALCRTNQRR